MKCSDCDGIAAMAVKTQGADSVRGLSTTVYYEPERAPHGAQPQCVVHGLALLNSLLRVLT